MYSLFSCNRRYSNGRNALSLYFEYEDDDKNRVHRQFYISSELIKFFNGKLNDLSQLNFKDTINDIDIAEFTRLLKKILDKKNKNECEDEFAYALSKYAERLLNYDQNLDITPFYIEQYIEIINDLFSQYYYSLDDKTIHKHKDITKKTIDDLINKVNAKKQPLSTYLLLPKKVEEIIDKSLYELKIYNVGQANCSALVKHTDRAKSNYKVLMVFDFGYQTKRINDDLDDMLNKIDSNTIMLISHFHSDYFNNIVKRINMPSKYWILLNCDFCAFKGLIPFQMLLNVITNNLCSVYVYDKCTYISPNILIYQRTDNKIGDLYQHSLINSQCFVCKLSIDKTNVLIPADALYGDFGNELVLSDNKKYDHIVIPHHGCKYVSTKYASSSIASIINKYLGDNTVGYLMCGKNNYGHANINHMFWYGEKNKSFLSNHFLRR